MKDTSSIIKKKIVTLMKMKSRLDRLKMGADMFDTARSLMKSSLNGIPKKELRLKIFLRLYGNEFDQTCREKIASVLGCKDKR